MWGRGPEERTIHIDRRAFPVRQILYDALEQISAHHGQKGWVDTYIWVDAICINQADAKEKGFQIVLMRQIYEKASHVLVWLGIAENEIHNRLAFAQIDYYSKMFVKVATKSKPDRPWWWPKRPHLQGQIAADFSTWILANDALANGREDLDTHAALSGLRALFESKWWTRTWIFQEATVPESFYMRRYVLGQSFQVPKGKVKFLCGKETTDWFAISTILSVVGLLQNIGPVASEIPLGVQTHAAALLKFRLNRLFKFVDMEDLFAILSQFRSTECTDPRDKVYAPLCLAPKAAIDTIVPDLSKDTRSVYLDVARFSLSRPGRELDFLGHAILIDQTSVELPLQHRNQPIPSWIPDWYPPVRMLPIPKRLFVPKRLPRRAFTPNEKRMPELGAKESRAFDATARAKSSASIVGFQLCTEAIFCVTIQDIIPYSGPNQAAVTANARAKKARWTTAWENKYPTDGTFMEAIQRTHVMDLKYDGLMRPSERGGTHNAAIMQKPLGQLSPEEHQILNKANHAWSVTVTRRSLCVTSKGYVAMVPASSVVGDSIFALIGGQVLYVLRPESIRRHEYRYVGEAYVHGLMDGEVMNWVRAGDARIVGLKLI